ncbi:TonB-dependent receptor [Roseateles oligotrophus]|uniref:TonB-dependent receptor n=1 Tax=Roseateles oligotrophus TaxID=1769250 RepID=A0ABT2YKN2_9BURK|nr:TonB-dependent receptor [Roseateles oligotrophus]MCV2370620.1 TonB-dependent receptor [Roseateles oligotrophus]
MNRSKIGRRSVGAGPSFQMSSLALACGLCMAGAANAQQASAPGKETVLETVVVTGIRAGLESSVSFKRNASGLVDGIMAEDIGKFPDTNLAEAMQRISGVSIDRSNGEGTRVTVRGMGPEFNLVLLNGRQMPGSLVDGSAPSSRSFDFSNLAAEGVSGLEVYKTSRASTPTGGMGATINIRTPRPFDSKETIASFGVKMVKDDSAGRLPGEVKGDSVTPELSGIYSTTTADRMFGVTLIGSFQDRDSGYTSASANNGWKSFKGDAAGWGPLPNPAPEVKNRPGPTDIYNVPQSLQYSMTGISRERLNGQLVLQARPIKDLTATLDYTMSDQKFLQKRNDLSAWFNFGGQFGEYTKGPIATPLIYGEHMTNSDVATGTSRISTKNENRSLGLNLEWKASPALKFDLDAHHSTAQSGADSPLGTSVVIGTASQNRGDTFVDFSQKFPVLSIKNAPTNAALQELQGSVFGNSFQRNEVNQVQARGAWAIDADSSLDFGLSLTEVKNRSAFANVQRNNWGSNAAGGPGAVPDDIWKLESVSKYFSQVPGSNDPRLYNQFLIANFDDIRNAAIKLEGSDKNFRASFDFKDDYRTTEKSNGLFAQYNRSFDAGIPIDIALGGRYERTTVESPSTESVPTSVRWVADNELPVVFGGVTSSSRSGKYDYFLPSIDLSADVTANTKLRVSYGETIGRPGWASIQGGRTIDGLARIDGGSGAVGNPALKPLLSRNIDLSAEHYFGKGSFVSASYFHKSISNYIDAVITPTTVANLHTPVGGAMYKDAISLGGCSASNSGCIRDYIFKTFPNAAGVDVAGKTITGQPSDPLLPVKLNTSSNNPKKQSLNGMELNVQHTFKNGFGGSANYTRVRSDLKADNNALGAQFALVGLGDSGNLVGFYENDTFSTRLAYNWRGEFLSASPAGAEGAQPLYVEKYGQWDMSMSYNVNKKLSVQFEVINLTDEITRTHFRNVEQIGNVTQLGRRFMLGARYRF